MRQRTPAPPARRTIEAQAEIRVPAELKDTALAIGAIARAATEAPNLIADLRGELRHLKQELQHIAQEIANFRELIRTTNAEDTKPLGHQPPGT